MWGRYGKSYDAATIREVFPDNEIAEWVIDARRNDREPSVVFRDVEMSFERNFMFGEYIEPKQMRSYEEEIKVQERRRHYREKTVERGSPAEACGLPKMPRRIYAGEELPEVLLEEWRRVAECISVIGSVDRLRTNGNTMRRNPVSNVGML